MSEPGAAPARRGPRLALLLMLTTVLLAAACDRPAVAERETRTLADYGPPPARDAFAADLAAQFDLELGRWRQYGLGPILNRWLAAAHPLGSPLTVHEPNGQRIAGAFDGLAPDGALRLRLADGTTRVIHAGDVMLEGH